MVLQTPSYEGLFAKLYRYVLESPGVRICSVDPGRPGESHEGDPSVWRNLHNDEAAIRAVLGQSWSNGHVEGQVHRLKVIKRSMYG